MKLALAAALSLSMPVPALAGSAACAPEPVSREAWPVVMPRMTLAEAEAGFRAAGIEFESRLAYDKAPTLSFECGAWHGRIAMVQNFPDVAWHVESVDFTSEQATRDAALDRGDQAASGMEMPDRFAFHSVDADGRFLAFFSIDGKNERAVMAGRQHGGGFERQWKGPTTAIAVTVLRTVDLATAKDPHWVVRISYERNSLGQD